MTWNEWIVKYSSKIDQNEYGYERMFVDRVLSKLYNIEPDDVIPQYHFIDKHNGNRYIDFVICITSTELLPIELDGAEKFSKYDILPDTLDRQNDLIKRFGRLLRYSNRQLLNNPQSILEELKEYIDRVKVNKSIQELQKVNLQRYDETVKLAKETKEQTNVLKQEIDRLSKVHQETARELNELKTTKKPIKRNFTGVLLITVLVISLSFLFKENTNATEKYTDQEMQDFSDRPLENPERCKECLKPSQAKDFIGQDKLVCGIVTQIKEIPQGTFINFESKYPNTVFTAIVWKDKYKEFAPGYIKSLQGQRTCAEGVIEEYQGKPRIQILGRAYLNRVD